MEEPVVSRFRQQVLTCPFTQIDISKEATTLVRTSSTIDTGLVEQKREFLLTEQIRMIEYLLYEQKYMEAVAAGRTVEAIEVLQTKLY